MPNGTGLDEFQEQYKDRFFDVGIAEQHGVTLSAGLATVGYTPVIPLYSSFLQRAYDQTLHDVCLQKLHVVFPIDRAGIVGADGETHQGVYDISYLSHMPNMTILSPATLDQLEYMLDFAINSMHRLQYVTHAAEQKLKMCLPLSLWDKHSAYKTALMLQLSQQAEWLNVPKKLKNLQRNPLKF